MRMAALWIELVVVSGMGNNQSCVWVAGPSE